VPATHEESEFHRRLISFLEAKIRDYYRMSKTEQRALGLLNALIFKRASSSPAAAINTMQVILEKRAYWLQHKAVAEKDLKKRVTLARALLGTSFEEYDEDVDSDKVIEELQKGALHCFLKTMYVNFSVMFNQVPTSPSLATSSINLRLYATPSFNQPHKTRRVLSSGTCRFNSMTFTRKLSSKRYAFQSFLRVFKTIRRIVMIAIPIIIAMVKFNFT